MRDRQYLFAQEFETLAEMLKVFLSKEFAAERAALTIIKPLLRLITVLYV